jgi:hypothetical protein
MSQEEDTVTDTTGNSLAREQELRHCVLAHRKLDLNDSVADSAADAYHDLLADAHEEMIEDLLRPVFNWSDFWPKRPTAGLPVLSRPVVTPRRGQRPAPS